MRLLSRWGHRRRRGDAARLYYALKSHFTPGEFTDAEIGRILNTDEWRELIDPEIRRIEASDGH